jgi:DNA-binding protein Fis
VKDLGFEPRRLSGVIEVPAWSSTAIPIQAANTEAARSPARDADGSDDAGNTVRLPANLELAEAERRYARAILERCEGNQSAAARQLGISRNKLPVCSRRDRPEPRAEGGRARGAGRGTQGREPRVCGGTGDRVHARWRTRVWARRSSVDHRITMTGSAISTTDRCAIHPAVQFISRRSPARAAALRVDVANRTGKATPA